MKNKLCLNTKKFKKKANLRNSILFLSFFLLLSLFETKKVYAGTTTYSSGSGTFNTPVGTTSLLIEVWGGGGGGAGGGGANGDGNGGGGGGGYARKTINSPSASYDYIVGISGPGGASGAVGGSAGNTTVGGSEVVAQGGRGGAYVAGGGGVGGAGGTANTGDTTFVGGSGGTGSGTYSGGGGGGAGSTGNGGNGSGTNSGPGASELGGNGGLGILATNSPGTNGSNYGGGGGSSTKTTAGRPGAGGYIRITYYGPPTVTTQDVTDFTFTSGSANGNITNTGDLTVTRRGFAYMLGTSGNPTTANSVIYADGSFSTGAYILSLSGLSSGTGYRVRAYAVNSAGTGYGDTVQLNTLNYSPAVVLNTGEATNFGSDNTPVLEFTGSDSESNTIVYHIQIDTVTTFNSGGLIEKVSSSHLGFLNTVNSSNTSPFTPGQKVSYTVQGGEELSPGTYYWRVKGLDPSGSNTFGSYPTYRSFIIEQGGATLSGNIYQTTNESSVYLCSSSGNLTVNLKVQGLGSYSAPCTADTGAWQVPGVTVSSGQTVYAYLSGGTVRGSTVLVSDGAGQNNIPLIQNRVVLRDDLNGSITNIEISSGNTADGDDLIDFSGNDLTVSSSYEIHIYTGNTYVPGANVSTGKLHVVGNYTGSSETLSLRGSGTGTSRPLYIDGGTFTVPSTVEFKGASDSDINNVTYTNLSLIPTITGAASYTFLGATSVNGNFMVNPPSSASNTLTVYLGGTTVVDPTKTTTVSGTTSGLSVLDTVNGSNYSLYTGLLDIQAAGTLEGRSSNITLTGTSGTLFTKTGIFNGTGTVIYSSDSAQTVGTTPNYYNLTFSGAGIKTTNSGTLAVTSGWSVGSTTALNTNNTVVSASGNFTGTGSVTQGNGNISLNGDWTNTGSFTSGSASVIFTGSGKQIAGPGAGITFNGLTVNGTYTNNNPGTITVSSSLAGSGTLTQGNSSTLDIKGVTSVSSLNALSNINTVSYTGSGDQTVKGTDYSTLILGNSGAKTMTSVNTISTLTIQDSATMIGNEAFTVSGPFNYSSSGLTTLTSSKNISIGSYNQSGGTLTDNGNTITVTGTGASTWTKSSGTFTPTGTIKFTGGSPQIGTSNFNSLNIDTTNGNTAILMGNITLLGNMILTSGSFNAGSNTIGVKGNWTNTGGTFVPGTSVVTLDGGTQSITGNTNFYGLAVTGSSPRTVSFGAGSVTSIANNGSLTFSGAEDNLLTLRSSDDATDWHLHVSSTGTTVSVLYTDVTHSDAGDYKQINAIGGTNVDGGAGNTNTNWLFVAAPPSPINQQVYMGRVKMSGVRVN